MMDEAVLTAVAAAVASRTVEGLTDAGRVALDRLTRLVRRNLGDPPAAAALDAAQADPSATGRVATLRGELEHAASHHRLFAEELTRLWREVQQASHPITSGGVVNQVPGTVHGSVVQAGIIHGGVAFGSDAAGRPRAGQ